MTDNDKVKCPLCGNGFLDDEICDHETYVKDGAHNVKLILKDLPVKRCSSCKEEFLPKESLERVQLEKHKKLGILSNDQLKALRKKLGYSQEEMADLLGVGKKSYLRWENGLYLQNKAMDRYIRLIAENPENLRLLKRFAEQGKK